MKKLFVYLIALAVILPTATVADNKTPQKPPKITRPTTTTPAAKPKPKPTQKPSSKPKPTQKPADNKQNEEMERLRRENEQLRHQQEQQAEAERKRRQQEEEQRRQQEQQVFQQLSDKRFTVGGVSFTMVGVQGGTFQMGSITGDKDEKPVHSVTLNSYYIGQTEVTQALWGAVMGSNPSLTTFEGDNLPVDDADWNHCQDFITGLNAKLSSQLGKLRFRLPSEAEWEYAARGGNHSMGYKYSGSDNIDDVAWYGDNSGHKTHDVATKSPNELGIYDMSGNVFEWCQDWYGEYSSSSQTNPTGPSSGSIHVLRGGGWSNFAWHCYSDYREELPMITIGTFGLRLALSE